ncbi:MAG: hypothetical protein KDN05_04855 [Verrucomicrobiae bacterium]|nr:hypothetical protein [Verrucomicrobiae bacterium]MCP5532035.1 hypothetical protein [Akkermansiaceae bacterium]MCP5543928.1 hypothetical protein [Akkermansiaceae bacterium]MCP5547560.1 hypothetical protein [Akkermansiaceae bacterium]
MKSCFGLLILLFVIIGVIGGGGLIWYLSSNTEFTRADAAPKATPVPGQIR